MKPSAFKLCASLSNLFSPCSSTQLVAQELLTTPIAHCQGSQLSPAAYMVTLPRTISARNARTCALADLVLKLTCLLCAGLVCRVCCCLSALRS